MRSCSIAAAALLGLPACFAFPADIFARTRDGRNSEADMAVAEQFMANRKRQLPGVIPPFDAEVQYVSNTGQYAFVAPGATDARGPCPGLNA
jgi:hypothetical protein